MPSVPSRVARTLHWAGACAGPAAIRDVPPEPGGYASRARDLATAAFGGMEEELGGLRYLPVQRTAGMSSRCQRIKFVRVRAVRCRRVSLGWRTYLSEEPVFVPRPAVDAYALLRPTR